MYAVLSCPVAADAPPSSQGRNEQPQQASRTNEQQQLNRTKQSHKSDV